VKFEPCAVGITTGSGEVSGSKGFDKSQINNNNNYYYYYYYYYYIKLQNIQHGKYDYMSLTATTEQLQHYVL